MTLPTFNLREEEQSCLTLKEEAFDKLLELLKREIEKVKTFKSGKDVVEISKRVAQAFSEKYPSPREVFEGKPRECKEFFYIFTESELLKLREFSGSVDIKVETKTFKEALFEYVGEIFDLFKEKTQIRDGDTEQFREEINRAWNKFLNGYFKSLIYKDNAFKTKIATVKVKGKGEKVYSSDPFLLTYAITFSPYGGIVKSMEEEKLKEDIKRYLERKVLQKLQEAEDETLSQLLGISLAEEKLKNNGDKIEKILEGLFEAVDTLLRARIELEHFKELVNIAENTFGEELKPTAEAVLNNLNLLGELLEEDNAFWSEIVDVLPVGFTLEDKITDYLAGKNFWHFLYTYRVKINEISEGAVEQFLKEKAKTRGEYFIKMSKKLEKILKNPEGLSTDDLRNITTYTKALLKLLFYYGKADKGLAEEIYELYGQVKEIRDRWLYEEGFKPAEADKEVLKKLQKLAKEVVKNAKGYKKFETFYGKIAKELLKSFVQDLPSHPLRFLVAVDFDSLAEDTVRAINEGSIDPKTRRYRGVVKLLSPAEEKENYEYILSVETYSKNFRLDLSDKLKPEVKTLKPLKNLEGFFNLTAELSREDFGKGFNKTTYKVGFALSFLILSSLIAKHSDGVLLGFSLPPSDGFRAFLYALSGAVAFSLNSDKVVSIQNFNWNGIKTIEVGKKSISRGINFHINQNKKFNIKGKIENGLNSAYSNLPFEVEGISSTQKVAVLAVSHPEVKDKSLRAIVGEAYVFEPLKGKTLFGTDGGVKVFRKTLFGHFSFTEGDRKALLNDYKKTLKGFLKELKTLDVEKVYLIPPLPIYRGLSTKEVLYKELYFSEVVEELNKLLKVRLIFSSFAVVYTPFLSNFKRRIKDFLTQRGINVKELKGEPFAVNLFENLEELVAGEGLKPLVIPKFAIIPLFSMEEGKREEKTLNHHAFIYSIPSPEVFGGLKPEKVFITEEERMEIINLLGAIHLIQYQKWSKDEEKTFKRNPFYVFPVRRSGDKNVYTLTEFELFFNSTGKPKLQTVLSSFVMQSSLWD